jgi:hypothetical protein
VLRLAAVVNAMTVEIGKRWRPGHRVYRDDDTGDYSEVNSLMLTEAEWRVQNALLTNPKREKVEPEGRTNIVNGVIGTLLALGDAITRPPRTHS